MTGASAPAPAQAVMRPARRGGAGRHAAYVAAAALQHWGGSTEPFILEFFEEDWSPIPTLIRHSLVYTVLQGKFDATLTGMQKHDAW